MPVVTWLDGTGWQNNVQRFTIKKTPKQPTTTNGRRRRRLRRLIVSQNFVFQKNDRKPLLLDDHQLHFLLFNNNYLPFSLSLPFFKLMTWQFLHLSLSHSNSSLSTTPFWHPSLFDQANGTCSARPERAVGASPPTVQRVSSSFNKLSQEQVLYNVTHSLVPRPPG